ncbi:MAG: hypothetical protein EB078_07065 [Proteobacteria bacterium]|nr:hypothetical protein [Pseudomonadota bacterium]NDC24730.1 hypothetical protein [Pseudomonadota bacterium]NDD04649.1 hypothetical protein [Pseudomonadota bacterium]NDG26742.1 hypothetical protein [Pseudomonadota bacterium]
MRKWLVLASTLVLLGNHSAPLRYFYVEVPMNSPQDLAPLRARGLDVAGINLERKTASIVVQENQLGQIRDLTIISQRPVERLDEEYKTPEEVEATLIEVEKNFPQLVKRESIGRSVEGREIWAVALTQKQSINKSKKTMLIDAMHHAREVMTTEVALDMIDYLTSHYQTDSQVKEWLDNYEVWVVPMLNPDGNHRVWNEENMWRKNTQGGHGVDVNRNYPYAWGSCNGSSGLKTSDTYRGHSAGSEPETQALMALAKRIQPKFNLSYHSYSEIVIYPFGCSPETIPAPDSKIYLDTGRELAKKLVKDSGQGSYQSGTSYELLYNVDGGSIDWMYGKEKIMAFVVEVNGTWQGFQPSYKKWRDVTVQRQRAGWMYLLEQMAAPGIK